MLISKKKRATNKEIKLPKIQIIRIILKLHKKRSKLLAKRNKIRK